MKNLSKNIRILREKNGFSQQNIADFLGIERSLYGFYENGSREIPFDRLEKLASLFGCELNTLLTDNEQELEDILICALRSEEMNKEDIKTIASFKDIVLTYLKISRLLENEKHIVN